MKEKKRKGKTYFRLARFDADRPSDVPKDVTTRLRKLSVHDVKNFYLNKTDVIITVITSKVFRV